MKLPVVVGLVAAAVLITVAIEEARIAKMRPSAKPPDEMFVPPDPPTKAAVDTTEPPVVRTMEREELKTPVVEKIPDPKAESFATTARKMWDNPAGKSMMSQGAKMAVTMMYQDFVTDLNLGKEETGYFKNLLGKEVSDQQELGMKMLGATPEEQKSIGEELSKRATETEAEIKKFLNNEEDFKKFTDYKNHLPERQQLDGIRAAMDASGMPLDVETESKLVDAMFRARTTSKAPDITGAKGLDALASGNITETFETSWDMQQEALAKETAMFLSESQKVAFQNYQKQVKEMQMMSLKMAEKMMNEKQPAE